MCLREREKEREKERERQRERKRERKRERDRQRERGKKGVTFIFWNIALSFMPALLPRH